jgi:hypothetical protein
MGQFSLSQLVHLADSQVRRFHLRQFTAQEALQGLVNLGFYDIAMGQPMVPVTARLNGVQYPLGGER